MCIRDRIYRVDEIVGVIAGMEAHDGAAEQAFQNRFPPRADAEDFLIGPGNVPEGDDGGLRQLGANHLRQQGKVVILNQYHRVGAPRIPHHGIGEFLVDLDVLLPIRTPETASYTHLDVYKRQLHRRCEAIRVLPAAEPASPTLRSSENVAPQSETMAAERPVYRSPV